MIANEILRNVPWDIVGDRAESFTPLVTPFNQTVQSNKTQKPLQKEYPSVVFKTIWGKCKI